MAEPLVLTKKPPRPPPTKPTAATLHPETTLLAVEPVVPLKKGPRPVDKQAKTGTVEAQQKLTRTTSAEERATEKKSCPAKAVKRNLLKANEVEKVCLPATKNGVKKSLPNHVTAMRLAERKKPRLSSEAEESSQADRAPPGTMDKVSPTLSTVDATNLASRKSAVVTNTADDSEDTSSERTVVGSQLPSKPRKENGSVSHSVAKKVQQSPAASGAVVAKTSAVLQQTSKTPVVVLPPKLLLNKRPQRRKFAHGWSWDGEPIQKVIVMNNEDSPRYRLCFPAMRHIEGDVIRVRDCVLLRSGPRKIDLPFVAKVAALWENAEDGEMMMSLLWYYRPEHTDQGRKAHHMEDEIFASKHRDANSVACIEDKCYVLTFAEYCRYRARTKMLEEGLRPPMAVVPDQEGGYSRRDRLPPGRMDPQMVFFCRRVYDFRQKRILKNPS